MAKLTNYFMHGHGLVLLWRIVIHYVLLVFWMMSRFSHDCITKQQEDSVTASIASFIPTKFCREIKTIKYTLQVAHRC